MSEDYKEESTMSIAEIQNLYTKLLEKTVSIRYKYKNKEVMDENNRCKEIVIGYLQDEGVFDLYDTQSFLESAITILEPKEFMSTLQKANLKLDKDNVLVTDWDNLKAYEGSYVDIYDQLYSLEFYLKQLTINEVETLMEQLNDGPLSEG